MLDKESDKGSQTNNDTALDNHTELKVTNFSPLGVIEKSKMLPCNA